MRSLSHLSKYTVYHYVRVLYSQLYYHIHATVFDWIKGMELCWDAKTILYMITPHSYDGKYLTDGLIQYIPRCTQ